MDKIPQPTKGDRHLSAGDWLGTLRKGFDGSERRSEAVFHLGTGCRECSEGLRRLAGRPEALEGWKPLSDPVDLALRRWIDLRRHPGKRVDLRPMHRFWIDRESFGPLDFCRAVVEEGRQMAIDRPEDAVAIFKSLLGGAVCDDRLLKSCGAGVHDLRGLLRGCLVEACCVVPDLHEAELHAEEGKRELALGSGDRELLATFYEQQAALVAVQGGDQPELVYLDAAAGLLLLDPVPGRRAETLVRKGVALLRRGCGYEAAEVLAKARACLPDGVCTRLRLEVIHRQALAAVRNRDFTDALTHVGDAGALYAAYPLEPMATQKLWIQGVSYLSIDRQDLAEGPLEEALERYGGLREWDGAAQTLAMLASLYSEQGRTKDLAALEKKFAHVICSHEAGEVAQAGLRRAVQLTAVLKVPMPLLEQKIADLAPKEDEAAVEEAETSSVN